MRTSRLRRQTPICRHLFFAAIVLVTAPLIAAARDLSGTVVDASGRAVPRARIRVLDAAGAESSSVFADEFGQFELRGAAEGACRIEASLAGFEPASTACSTSTEPVRLVLEVAPIRETTIVTATRTDAPTSQIGASATVFTADDLERRQKPLLADLLTSTPGAMVVRTGQPGALTSLFVRGGESDYNMVVLDGVPLNEPGGTFYFSNLTTENLDRVEIVRGAYSALFGTDAMGSVVQLFTRRAERGRPRGAVQLDGGSYHTLYASASVSGSTGDSTVWDYSAGAARFNSDNRTPNSRFENTTASGSIGVTLPKSVRLRAVGRTERGHAGTPGPTAYGRPDLDAHSDRDDDVGSVAFDQHTGSFRQQASYSSASSRQQSTNLILDPPYRATFRGRTASRLSTDFLSDSVTNLRRQHAIYQADIYLNARSRWGDHILTALADWDGERSRVENRLAGSTTINTRNNNGVAVQDQMLWARTFVTVGGRVERNDAFGTAVVPRATLAYVAHPATGAIGDTMVRVGAGAGIKEPSMIESFSASAFFRGNPDLKPERARTFEAGISQRFARDRAKAELTFFHNRFTDLISLVTNPVTFEGQYQNLGVARARGIEATFDATPLRGVAVRAGYTFLDTKVLETAGSADDPVFGLGRPLLRRPRHSGFAGVSYARGRIVADLNGVFVGRFADSDFGLFNPSFLESPGHQLWDARVSVQITPQIAGLLSIDNLTNEDYSEPIGYQPLLRAVRVGVRVKF
jgi:outer membrane cobalamin receptor